MLRDIKKSIPSFRTVNILEAFFSHKQNSRVAKFHRVAVAEHDHTLTTHYGRVAASNANRGAMFPTGLESTRNGFLDGLLVFAIKGASRLIEEQETRFSQKGPSDC